MCSRAIKRQHLTDFFPVIPRSFPFQKTDIKKPAVTGWLLKDFWSARENLNLRPPTPHDGELPLKGCYVPKAEVGGDRDSLFNSGLSLTFANKKAARRQLSLIADIKA